MLPNGLHCCDHSFTSIDCLKNNSEITTDTPGHLQILNSSLLLTSCMSSAAHYPDAPIQPLTFKFQPSTFSMTRHDGRQADQLRDIQVDRTSFGAAPGRVLIRAGKTIVLCTASISTDLPPWKLKAEAPSGWVSAEYNMLPGSTSPRKARRQDGRGTEIQRLIGRSLRAVVDMQALGPRMVTVDCDVLQADGGTRTLSITGGFIALVEALYAVAGPEFDPRPAIVDSVAAVSVGIVDGQAVLDLDYPEDSQAEVDLNAIMTGQGGIIEVQGTAERRIFSRGQLDQMLDLATAGISQLTTIQRDVLGERCP